MQNISISYHSMHYGFHTLAMIFSTRVQGFLKHIFKLAMVLLQLILIKLAMVFSNYYGFLCYAIMVFFAMDFFNF